MCENTSIIYISKSNIKQKQCKTNREVSKYD